MLLNKCVNEFYMIKQFDKQMQECLTILVNKSASLNISNGTILVKTLEWLDNILSRLNGCQNHTFNHLDDDDEEQHNEAINEEEDIIDLNNLSHNLNQQLGSNAGNSDIVLGKILKVFDASFENHAFIINLMTILRGDSTDGVDESSDTNILKKATLLIFKIFNLGCSVSSKIRTIVLKNGFMEVISNWILSKDKSEIKSLDNAFHSDASEASDLEEFKISK